MSIEAIIEGIIGREGRFSDNPLDKGGPTMYGITQSTARRHGYTGDMRDLPRAIASKIYQTEYVVAPGFMAIAAINARIAEKMVDAGVNCGPGRPGPWLQRTLNLLNRQAKLFDDLEVDGKLGPATQAALKNVLTQRGADGAKVIMLCLQGLHTAYYIDITEKREANEEFFFGWIDNRVELP